MKTKGAIHTILTDVYNRLCSGYMNETKQRIIRLQLTLKTGLNLSDHGPETLDTDEDVDRLLKVIRGAEFGLGDFAYKR